MNRSLRTQLSVEPLEERCCPSVTANLVNGHLVVTANEAASMSINQTGSNAFLLSEINSGTNAFIEGVTGDVIVRLSDHNDSLDLNLNGFTTPGGVSIDLGDGNNEMFLEAFGTGGGVISGNLAILGGSGRDQLFLGDVQNFSESDILQVNGATLIATRGGDDALQFGPESFFGSEVRFLGPAVIHLGEGNDRLTSGRATFEHSSLIHLGKGDDIFDNFFGSFQKTSLVLGGRGTDGIFGNDTNLIKLGF